MRPDEILFGLAQNGDGPAFEELYERYQAPLFAFVLRYLKERPEAEDVFHEIFLVVLNQKKIALAEGGFRPWIYTVARNFCLNRLRTRNRSQAALGRFADEFSSNGGAEELATDPLFPDLEETAKQLSRPLSDVYKLRVEGMSYQEIANTLEVPLGTVKSRMNQLLGVFKKKVKIWNVN